MVAVKYITEQIRIYIAQARVKAALEELMKLAAQMDNPDFLNRVILTSSAYHELQSNVLTNDENAGTDKNKIIMALLSLVEEIATLLPESIDYQMANENDAPKSEPSQQEVAIETSEEAGISPQSENADNEAETENTSPDAPFPMSMGMTIAAPSPQKTATFKFPAFNYFYAKIENASALEVANAENLLKKALILYTFETTGVLIEKATEINGIIEDQDAFSAWLQTKRAFSAEELKESVAIKFTQTGQLTKVNIENDGKLMEGSLRDIITHKWEGEWAVSQGILEINIADYHSAFFASAEGIIHAGVEYIDNERPIIHNLVIMPQMENILY